MADRLKLIEKWLREDLSLGDISLRPASEDASFRRYFRAAWDNGSAVVMDAPPDREDCKPFIDITGRLISCKVNVPRIRASNLSQGFLLLDDLGNQLYLDVLTDKNADQLYRDAIHAIIKIQASGDTAGLPVYDEKLLSREMCLFSDWLVTRHLKIRITPPVQKLLDDVFLFLIEAALQQPRVFVHRDYHSRNLMFVEQQNPGILDYQDAVFGPVTYDLVSLFKDCYIKWPQEKIAGWLKYYVESTRRQWPAGVSEEQFIRWFDLMGVQRHLKASGIFARLLHRDGKSGFIQDIPRTLSYILDLEHQYPELSPLAEFIRESVMPGLTGAGR